MGPMRRAAAPVLACMAAVLVVPVGAAGTAWQPVASVPGIFDLGPRPDGRLVVAGAGTLYRLDPAGAVTIQILDSSPSPSPSPSPTTAPRPAANPRPRPQSPAAFLAIIVTLAVLGAGGLAVLRARWR